ncbi:4-oxalocrotonate tautomerase DmpI [Paenibacillus polymyxa]|uniref:4-oxalocrotonate tautomerase DmpI n=1 Tax=Paenibacillus polymyxa TaxID=1406 RepID=UPI0007E9279D|nr:4-oxalocrotonate tautomerase DmpI [Paenibacillus polymyxa]OAZ40268.1 hypothetical protein A9Z39_23625 [Paenibacillus polymyxa]
MPVITIEAAKLTKEQKRKLVKDLTTSASTIMNIPEQAFFVFVRENELDEPFYFWGSFLSREVGR